MNMKETVPAVKIRYHLEHRLLPKLLYSEEKGTRNLMKLIEEKGAFFIEKLNMLGRDKDYECPYSESDFVFDQWLVPVKDKDAAFMALQIQMPEPERAPLCYKIIICFDLHFSHIWYFTVEKSTKVPAMICSWIPEGIHLNHGSAPESDVELRETVYEIYSSQEHLPALSEYIINLMAMQQKYGLANTFS